MSLPTTPRRGLLAGVVAAATALTLTACSNIPQEASPGSAVTLNIVGFAVPAEANKRIGEAWNTTPDGAGVGFQTSYGASGDQSRNVANGQPADYVHFSLEGDVTRLVDKKLVAADWNAGPHKGIVSKSVVALVVRPGQPPGDQGLGRHREARRRRSSPRTRAPPAPHAGTSWPRGPTSRVRVAPTPRPRPTSPSSSRTWSRCRAAAGTRQRLSPAAPATSSLLRERGDPRPAEAGRRLRLHRPGRHPPDRESRRRAGRRQPQGQAVARLRPFRRRPGDLTPRPASVRSTARSGADVKGANDPKNPFPEPKHLYTIETDFGGWPATNTKFFTEGTGIIPKLLSQTGKG